MGATISLLGRGCGALGAERATVEKSFKLLSVTSAS